MRQSAMRAFVAQAAGAAKEEPVPPPPPAKRHVSLAAIEEHNEYPIPAELTVLELDPVTEQPIPGRQASGTGTLTYDADTSSKVRVMATFGLQDEGNDYKLGAFDVNGVREAAQRILGSPFAMTDVVPGTEDLVIKARYDQIT